MVSADIIKEIFGKLISIFGNFFKGFMPKKEPSSKQKKWVRPEQDNDSKFFVDSEYGSMDSLDANKSDAFAKPEASPKKMDDSRLHNSF